MIPTRHRQMLLSILDLEHVTVNDIMIPRQDIASINIEDNWEDVLDQLRQTPHTRLPLHEGELDNLLGIIHMKRVAQELARDTLSRERLIEIAKAREPYFVPEGTSLTVQLNPVSKETLAEVRRWLSQGTGGGLDRGGVFFGSFVSVFVNPKIADADRVLRIRSQPFYRPKP